MHSLRKWSWLIGLVMIATGCWDRVESEERGFVVGAAIDSAEEKKWNLTYQFVVTSALSSKEGGSKQGGAFYNLSTEGNTLFKISRDMSTKVGRSPYLQHIKIILLSEEVAKKGDFGKAMDLFLRDHELRRAAKVMIADGEAKRILGINPTNEKLPVLYIDSISENPYKSSGMMPPTNVGKIHGYLLGKVSYAIPRIVGLKNKVKIGGAAIFKGKDNRMVGFINEKETAGLDFITGDVKGGAIEFKINDEFVVFELKGSKGKIHANVSDPEHPVFNIHIFAEGNVGESYASLDFLDQKVIAEVEKKVAMQIEDLANAAIDKLQKDYKTDALGLGTFLNREHYRTWKKIKDDWDTGRNLFSKCQIRIQVKVKMRIIGSIIESEKEGK